MNLKFLPVVMLVVGLMLFVASPSFAAKPPSLDQVIQKAAEKIEERLDKGTKVALINVQSPTAQFSEYVLNYLESILVNNGKLIVVDRSNLDKIRQELGFQLSGEVSDESAKTIGKMLGAGAIVTGSLLAVGDAYRLTLKAINVETATVAASYPADIAKNDRVKALLASGNTTVVAKSPNVTTVKTTTATAPAVPVAAYKIGDTGPAGGIIFYDKGNNRGGWRYLEAAPANTEKTALPYNTIGKFGTGSRKIGDGKENTKNFMEINEKQGGGINTAPWLCNDLNINGFNDWYLPTLDELLYMYNNLYLKGLGSFKSAQYWSSSKYGLETIDFSNGSENHQIWDKDKYQVRAVRQF